jgi:hypothetical protein
MKILELMAENQEQTEKALKRTGLFTSGIISKCGEQLIALFFTGRNHAGENLQSVLESRSKQLDSPIQMCDALSRNLPGEFKTILANCLSHGRRRFVDVVQNFHQQESGPLMEALHEWLEHQFSEKTVEPNSSLGEAITYMLNHWKELTLFLRKSGAPLDNNICERALKKAILHRKNALFYKTQNGARVGDLFMSLIHTAELSGANTFDYLCELQRHAERVKEGPGQWMPWNYRETLKRLIAEGNRLAPERSPPD